MMRSGSDLDLAWTMLAFAAKAKVDVFSRLCADCHYMFRLLEAVWPGVVSEENIRNATGECMDCTRDKEVSKAVRATQCHVCLVHAGL